MPKPLLLILALLAFWLPGHVLPAQRDSSDTIKSIRGKKKRADPRKNSAPPRRAAPRRASVIRRATASHPRPAPPKQVPTSTILVSSVGGGQFKTIGEAIRKSRAGARILVRAGVYPENVVVDKPLEIQSERREDYGSVSIEPPNGACLVINAERAVVRGLALHGSIEKRATPSYAVEVRTGKVLLETCDISTANYACVSILGRSTDVTFKWVKVHASAADCVRVTDGATLHMEDSEIASPCASGVTVNGGKLLVIGGKVHGAKSVGISITSGQQSTIDTCSLYSNGGADIEIGEDTNATIRSCKVGAEEEPADYGIHALSGSGGSIEGCTLLNHKLYGIFAERANGIQIARCQAKSAGIGFEIAGGRATLDTCEAVLNRTGGIDLSAASDSTVSHCRAHGNGTNVVPAGSTFKQTYLDANWGLRATGNSHGMIDDCEFFQNGLVGIMIMDDADPTIHKGKSHHHLQHGAYVVNGARPRFESFESYANGNCGFLVQSGPDPAKPFCMECDFHDNAGNGVAVENGGAGTFNNCSMRNNRYGVLVKGSTLPNLAGCRMMTNQYGLVFEYSASARVTDCEIAESKLCNVVLSVGSNPVLERCKIKFALREGIVVQGRSSGIFRNCDVLSNAGGPTRIETGSKPVFSNCTMQ